MASKIIYDENELEKLLDEKYREYLKNVNFHLNGTCISKRYKDFADTIENFEVREDDVWLCGYPKTGNNWVSEMIWCVANNLDFDGAKENIVSRFCLFEFCTTYEFSEIFCRIPEFRQDMPVAMTDSLNYAKSMPSPRFIWTHLPFHLLPKQLRTGEKKPKMIYPLRNVKDTCISYFHYSILLKGYTGNFYEFCSLFLAGKNTTYGSFWKHVLGYWQKREEFNIFFIKFEEMKKDLPSVLSNTAKFFDKTLSLADIEKLCHHLSFDVMKNNPATLNKLLDDMNKKYKIFKPESKFMRSGKTDQWKEDMPSDIIEIFDKKTEEYFKDSGLKI